MKYLILLLSLSSTMLWSQQQIKLIITPKVQGNQVFLLDDVTDLNNKKMQIEYFAYYLSDLHLFHDGNQDLDLSDSVFIVRNESFTLDLGLQNINQLEKVSFAVGVPEPLNHLDMTLYPDKHPLGFQVPSMHWGWTDGYMFMIVGGLADGDADDVPETTFQIHSFGDANYFHAEIPVALTANGTSGQDILLNCNLDEWFGLLDLAATGIHHGSTDLNTTILKNISTRPVFTAEPAAGFKDVSVHETGIVLSFTDANGLQVEWDEMLGLGKIELLDAQGKKMQEVESTDLKGSKNWGKQNTGIYFIRFYSKQNALLQQVKVLN